MLWLGAHSTATYRTLDHPSQKIRSSLIARLLTTVRLEPGVGGVPERGRYHARRRPRWQVDPLRRGPQAPPRRVAPGDRLPLIGRVAQ